MTTSQESIDNPTIESPGNSLLRLAETCWMEGDEATAEILIEAAAQRGELNPEALVWQAIAQFNLGKFTELWSTLARAESLAQRDERLRSLIELVSEATRTYVFDSEKHLMQIRSAHDFLSEFPNRGTQMRICNLIKGSNSRALNINTLSDVVVVGPEATIVDPATSTIFSNSFSSQNQNPLSISSLTPQIQTNLKNSIHLGGNTAHLCGKWSGNFFHWVNEILPRAFLLQQAGFDGLYMVPICNHGFIRDSLQMLGISREQIVTNSIERPVRCEHLVTFDSFWFDDHLENEWIMQELRACLLQQVDTSSALPEGAYGVYIMRKGYRSVRNNEEVQTLLAQHGIIGIHAEQLSFQEQISVAARSRIICGPHGSGLSLALFMPPESTMIEFISSDGFNPCFSYIAHLLNHRHFTVPSEGSSSNVKAGDVEPPLRVLKQILRRELPSPQ